ncbi:hypothetical protein Tco_0561780 [Tanacetum coccineum]
MTTKQLEDIHNFRKEEEESLYHACEKYNDLLYKCPTHDINSHQKVNIFYKGLSTMNRQLLDSQGPTPEMRPTKALTAIQTMVDHSQKWHDGTTSRNIRSNSSTDGLAALVNKIDAKFVKDLTSIRIVPSIRKLNKWTKPDKGNLDEQRPLTEEAKLKELLARHQEEYARRSAVMEVWIKKIKENVEINTRNQDASLKNLETHIEQLTEELRSMKEKSKEGKEENTIDQLPTKESNLGHFMLPCTTGNFNFYAMADLGASVNDSVWSKRYSKWCNKNSHDKKPRPRGYTFKEWVKLKKGHLDISKSVRKNLFRLWVIDKSTEALDPYEDPFGRCLDEYNWVFPKEIEQLSDEYEIKVGEIWQVLEEIWTKCKKARSKDKDWWYDYSYENEEKTKLALTRLNSSTWALKWFKRLVAYAKCNHDSYESELGDKRAYGKTEII